MRSAFLLWLADLSSCSPSRSPTSCARGPAVTASSWCGRNSVDVDDNQVRLRKPDGTIITVALAKLSPADRAFLAGLSAAKTPAGPMSEAEKAARAALEQQGLRITSAGLILAENRSSARRCATVLELRKNVKTAETALAQQEKQAADLKRQITSLMALDVNLNAQLANIRPGDTTANNKLVAAINANRSQVELLAQLATATGRTRSRPPAAAANDAREAFIQAVIDMRATADSLTQQYTQLKASDEAKQAVEQWNAASGKTLELAESRNFRQAPQATRSRWRTRCSPKRFRCNASAADR